MNTGAFLDVFLEHRFAGLREIGLDLGAIAKLSVIFVVQKANLEFKQAIYGDEEFTIESKVVEFGDRDCSVRCEMQNASGRVAATCDLTLVCVSKETRKPVTWDSSLVDRFYE
jgi:acyl-CoA thioesterase FadM